jgi:hypothetical protein
MTHPQSSETVMERSVRIGQRVKRNGSRHSIELLVAAAAVLLREGWGDPRDRIVNDAAAQLEVDLAHGKKRSFTDDEKAAGERVWREAVQAFSHTFGPDTTTSWLSPLTPLGLNDSGLWLSGPKSVTAWIDRRYRKMLEEASGSTLQLVVSEGGHDGDS